MTTTTPPDLLAHWTREDADEHAAHTVVVIPVGALEQHGPHLPLATDTILVEEVARRAAALVPGTVVGPTVPISSSDHHLPYGATASLSTSTLIQALTDAVESLLSSGFASVFLLNGHGGNVEIIRLVARDVGIRRSAFAGSGSYFELAADRLAAAGAGDVGLVPGHAGAFETSMMLAIHPELVRLPSVPHRERPAEGWAGPKAYHFATPAPFRAPDGFSDTPDAGSAERGAEFLSICVDVAREALADFADAVTQPEA
jgi:creatinine amidohydrolase